MALGRWGRVLARPRRKRPMPAQVSARVQSMKKQGPPPCGMNNTGWRVAWAVCMMTTSSFAWRKYLPYREAGEPGSSDEDSILWVGNRDGPYNPYAAVRARRQRRQ